jgi:hypothetical protein
LLELGVEFYRHVPAGNIEAHARYADLIPISNHSADRLGIAKMAVSADDTRSHVSITHAVLHLADGVFVVLSNDDRRGSIGILFGRGGQGGLLAGDLFHPRCLAVITPSGSAASLPNPAFGIDVGGGAELASTILIGVFTHHGLMERASRMRLKGPPHGVSHRISRRRLQILAGCLSHFCLAPH